MSEHVGNKRRHLLAAGVLAVDGVDVAETAGVDAAVAAGVAVGGRTGDADAYRTGVIERVGAGLAVNGRAQLAATEAQIKLDSSRQKLFALGLSEAEIADLPNQPPESLRKQYLRAPIAGRISERRVDLGGLGGRGRGEHGDDDCNCAHDNAHLTRCANRDPTQRNKSLPIRSPRRCRRGSVGISQQPSLMTPQYA